MHSGPLIAGVIGDTRRFYRVFGDTGRFRELRLLITNHIGGENYTNSPPLCV
jgi:hypothetical protein